MKTNKLSGKKNYLLSAVGKFSRVSFLHVKRRLKPVVASVGSSAGFTSFIGRCSQSKLLVWLWYSSTRRFDREQKAVLSGRFEYLKRQNQVSFQENQYKLRRNIHRLEKGLLMLPRRDVFAVDYIEETVSIFARLQSSPANEEVSTVLSWACDVLALYFDVVANVDQISSAREKFSQCMKAMDASIGGKTPYIRDLSARPDVSIEDFEELAKFRRSCRWFSDRTVPEEVIDRAIQVAGLSPSACNRQPYRFVVFNGREIASQVSAIPSGTVGYSENIPVFVVIVGDLSAFLDERDRHLIYIDSSLAAMSFQYALEVQGLGTCCINWPDIEMREKRMEKHLQLASYERPVLTIGLGYPAPEGMVAYSQKKTLSELREYVYS